jgi:hypothetical protein
MGKKKRVDSRKSFKETLDEVIRDAEENFKMVQTNIIAHRLQTGIDCGVPDDHLSAIFDLSVEEVQHFRNTGELS